LNNSRRAAVFIALEEVVKIQKRRPKMALPKKVIHAKA
jgi:hypothetical protein